MNYTISIINSLTIRSPLILVSGVGVGSKPSFSSSQNGFDGIFRNSQHEINQFNME